MDVAPGPLPQLDLPELIEVLKQEETEDRGCSIVQSLHTNTTEVGFLRESPNFELEDGEWSTYPFTAHKFAGHQAQTFCDIQQ